ncbi:hypothetical protein SDRG_06973 [Saprolegnia diclina VS20]|uniref:Uncharacterized protein n=1 Tax=Saprolegnia diclina (strain VS20) TaxID=1156394 RepID=T0RT85_SAPDV|nr:hypothetical protein SDRG_06973 [Saprolegnia diclina VS20]EQC35693.1 hypothetical protein SDRG_06973 [Saprolegnia diclina VS20]|eukprot:XP_008611010.1 hypothetical protein SDRG_06973 [Saprolegnia diclina VS20]
MDHVYLHVDGDGLDPEEDALLQQFAATKRVLGHEVARARSSETTHVLWVLAPTDGGMERQLSDRLQALAGDAALCVDLLFLHPNAAPYSQPLYDELLSLRWHAHAYCFEACHGDVARLAQVLGLLLSVPSQRVDQAAAEARVGTS